MRSDRLCSEHPRFSPTVNEGVEEGFIFSVVGFLLFAGVPGAELAVADGFGPVGGEGDSFDAVAKMHLFELGANELPEVLGVARGAGEGEFAGESGGVDAEEFEGESADAALDGEEFLGEGAKEFLHRDEDSFELGGGAVEEAAEGDGFGLAERSDEFVGSSKGLVEAKEDVFAETGEERFAWEGEEVFDEGNADMLEGFAGWYRETKGGSWEGRERGGEGRRIGQELGIGN
jgi:hypothetical protein